MAFSAGARKFMKVWVVFSGLLFFAQCAQQAQPYLKVIMGQKPAAAQRGRSAP